MKKKPWLVGLVLILFIAGLAIGIWQFYFRSPPKPDFDKVGGTILVYEIDRGHDDKEPDAALTAEMAQSLERRVDFAWVRPLDKGRVEIRIPRSGEKHEDDVLRVKELVAKTGLLEFRILANSVDDKEAIKDAREMINVRAENDAALQKELKKLQEKGLPPPGPRKIGAKEPTVYEIQLAKNNKSQVTYSWVELGPQERRMLNLDNAAEKDPERNKTWLEAKKFRDKATTLKDPSSAADRLLLQGALFFSRKCEDRNLPETDRKIKGVEYFVLARDSEIDPKQPENLPVEKRRTPRIDGSRLSSAMVGTDSNNIPVVYFTFNAAGGDLFANFTRKNIPSGNPEESRVKRHLAIILDGQIMSAPTINSEIRQQGQISGSFTKKEVDNLANILRSGALPALLKPLPVSETEVPGKKGK
jgi:SecD/SecF fusion protein